MTIYGTNFTGAHGGAVWCRERHELHRRLAATVITAVSPAGTASATVDITVTTPGGTSPQVRGWTRSQFV